MATKAKDSKDGEEKSRLTAEAARLKAPAVRKNKTTITTMAPTEPEAS